VVPSAEQSVDESAVPVSDGPVAQFRLASADAAPARSEAQASSELPWAYSLPERWARLASPVPPELLVLQSSPLAAELAQQCAALGAVAA
jgi:hypothetical protein